LIKSFLLLFFKKVHHRPAADPPSMKLSVLVRVGYCLGAVGKEVGSSMVRQSP